MYCKSINNNLVQVRFNMSEYIKILKKINFKYWLEKNEFTTSTPISPSQETFLTMIKRKGYLLNFKPRKGSDYTDIINKNISSFKNGSKDYEVLETTFDLIQAWGGKMGKGPYVNPYERNKEDTVREKFYTWKENYFKGAMFTLNNEPQNALKEWFKIKQLGMGFASKHLFFWSEQNHPILDTRISLILTGKGLSNNTHQYIKASNLILELSKYFNANKIETEKAIFCFSLNFFNNNDLKIKENPKYSMDIEIAKFISQLN